MKILNLIDNPFAVLGIFVLLIFCAFMTAEKWQRPESRRYRSVRHRSYWWELLLDHPARVLFSTFLALCCCGGLALLLPAATRHGINLLDATFTAVSAVCVTGLAVLDTPDTFTFTGQALILLLIQLGGLGIMSITTVALHAMGRRLSLRQEKVLMQVSSTSHQDLLASLHAVLLYTLTVEVIGAILLSLLFRLHGDTLPVWRGVFTAISAFCNAGFSLQHDSLVAYKNAPLILHTIALLIILGGLSPAMALLLPKWLAGRPIPLFARIPLLTSAILLIGGFIALLTLEWNGIFGGLNLADKLHNAWFQSATLRTAGFNSVSLSSITNPTLLIMLLLMFIGGSPGGTAGGVKTTTLAILALTFWNNAAGHPEIVMQNRRIGHATIYRAVTVVIAGLLIWFIILFMLETTQQISGRDLIFEVTSAVATVGLTLGATPLLDEPGKCIVIFAMFAGRIGPLTLFMLLGSNRESDGPRRHPVEYLSLT